MSDPGESQPIPARSPATGKGLQYVIVMVGLPARGKSYTARRLARYLSWLGYPTRVFNVGEARRAQLGPHQGAELFDPANRDARARLDAIAAGVMEELLGWLRSGGRIGILDATNSTRARRAEVRRRALAAGFHPLFVEVRNDDAQVIEENIQKTKLGSPDYQGMAPDAAAADFRKRLAHYERRYEPLSDDEGPSLRIADRGRHLVMHQIEGYVAARIVFFLMNLQITERPVLLARHGESEFNLRGRIGGDSGLTERGLDFALRLKRFLDQRFPPERELQVWTSTLRRTVETGVALDRELGQWRSLDEINSGVCDGWTYAEVEQNLPDEYAARKRDKLRYRYPRGESYLDVIQRVDRVIIEIERHRVPVLVIGHQAVLRALYGYFMDLPAAAIPHVPMPLHTVCELHPGAYVCREARYTLGPEASRSGSS